MYLNKDKLYTIIFEADTKKGRSFDIILLWLIILSVIVVMIDSIHEIHLNHYKLLYGLEWFFTIIFTIEYIFRLYVSRNPKAYATSFFGIIDLLSILPTYISLVIAGSQYLLIIRALRLLRIFRILKLVKFSSEGLRILYSMKKSLYRITIFFAVMITLATILGAFMYVIEAHHNEDFSSIPFSVYWAIVTITTVGYGDITPHTPLGQILASIIMLLGYAIIAVPTGIVSAELTREFLYRTNTQRCSYCGFESHADDAIYCKMCGHHLRESGLDDRENENISLP